ncbi:zinc finger protein 540 isoform X2 [Lingula anatina]|uniref:Zinc finger protein 540 isoform X2 n=1 Tax=Lingula anatina TaxID=7574 RepID=A0A1S3JTG3_LINAN|nr:zinc finger protein 540 isoform X2 [Lingula anatina]|eukprot:XP_013413401.1 zinc finger protein 540 isoform X2 [Lingula anatina]
MVSDQVMAGSCSSIVVTAEIFAKFSHILQETGMNANELMQHLFTLYFRDRSNESKGRDLDESANKVLENQEYECSAFSCDLDEVNSKEDFHSGLSDTVPNIPQPVDQMVIGKHKTVVLENITDKVTGMLQQSTGTKHKKGCPRKGQSMLKPLQQPTDAKCKRGCPRKDPSDTAEKEPDNGKMPQRKDNWREGMYYKEDGLFCCKHCDYKRAKWRQMSQHLNIHAEIKPFLCGDCGAQFHRKYHLLRHQKSQHGIEPVNSHKCQHCDKTFFFPSLLKTHMETAHRDTPAEYSCDKCDYKTHVKYYLHKHQAKHMGKIYKCEHCQYSTAWRKNLKEHSRRHTGERLKCELCPYVTVYNKLYRKHVQRHQDALEKLVCDKCGKEFGTAKKLREHEKLHLEVKKFQCTECYHETSSKSALRCHMKKHTSPRKVKKKKKKKTHPETVQVEGNLNDSLTAFDPSRCTWQAIGVSEQGDVLFDQLLA